jgi:hypothetical protein
VDQIAQRGDPREGRTESRGRGRKIVKRRGKNVQRRREDDREGEHGEANIIM